MSVYRKPHLFRDPGHRGTLRHDPRVPLPPYGSLKGTLELCFAGIWIWQILRQILCRFLITFFRYDYMGFSRISAGLWIYSRDLHYCVWFRCGLARPLPSPSTLLKFLLKKRKRNQRTRSLPSQAMRCQLRAEHPSLSHDA